VGHSQSVPPRITVWYKQVAGKEDAVRDDVSGYDTDVEHQANSGQNRTVWQLQDARIISAAGKKVVDGSVSPPRTIPAAGGSASLLRTISSTVPLISWKLCTPTMNEVNLGLP